ncbi:MAG: hypothetical protein IPK32_26355 [Verrucomicrobiaceae bacterium]|nr:hypothetical protein [Verrucomicrobiaceae bacterium]
MGYGDGYFRALSNRGQVVIRGERHPIAGRVHGPVRVVRNGARPTMAMADS